MFIILMSSEALKRIALNDLVLEIATFTFDSTNTQLTSEQA